MPEKAFNLGIQLEDTGDQKNFLIASPEKALCDITAMHTHISTKKAVTLLECHLEIRKQILSDKKLSRLCLPAGERHIVILPDKDELFARSLEALGVIIGR